MPTDDPAALRALAEARFEQKVREHPGLVCCHVAASVAAGDDDVVYPLGLCHGCEAEVQRREREAQEEEQRAWIKALPDRDGTLIAHRALMVLVADGVISSNRAREILGMTHEEQRQHWRDEHKQAVRDAEARALEEAVQRGPGCEACEQR